MTASRFVAATVSLPVLFAALGCAGPIINTPTPAPAARIATRAPATLLVAPVVLPSSTLTVGPAPQVTASFQAGDVRLREMQVELARLLASSGPTVLDERDVGGAPAGPSSYVLRVTVASYSENTSNAPEWPACIMFGSITVGLGYLACLGTRNTTTHTIELEARVYDASGAPIERVTRDGELELVVDTSERPALLRQTYRVEMQSGVHAGLPMPSGPDGERFFREQGTRLGQLVYQRIAPDIAQAIDRAARMQVAQEITAQVPTAGGETAPSDASGTAREESATQATP